MAKAEREKRMSKLRSAFARAESFQKGMRDPKKHRPTMTGEFLRARDQVDALVHEIIMTFDEPWSEEEQMLMRPL